MSGSLGRPDVGYVHAPGYLHPAAAVVVRSVRLACSDGGLDTAVDCVLVADLFSVRVRDAMRLLVGVGAGQFTGAVLGPRVEEAAGGRQVLIAPLRDRFPFVAGSLVSIVGGEAPVAVAAAALRATGSLIRRPPTPLSCPPTDRCGPPWRPTSPPLSTPPLTPRCLGDLLLAEGVLPAAGKAGGTAAGGWSLRVGWPSRRWGRGPRPPCRRRYGCCWPEQTNTAWPVPCGWAGTSCWRTAGCGWPRGPVGDSLPGWWRPRPPGRCRDGGGRRRRCGAAVVACGATWALPRDGAVPLWCRCGGDGRTSRRPVGAWLVGGLAGGGGRRYS